MAALFKRTATFLGLQRSVMGLLGMVILVGLGEKMAERFLPMYIISLGGGALAVGMLNGLDNLLSALYSFPGGYLTERIGTKRALLVFNVLAMAGFSVVILIPAWQAVIIASFLFLAWTAISLPATVGILSRVLPKEKHTMGMSMHSLVRRVPMFAGPLIGGACISAFGIKTGIRIGFFAALILSGLATIIQQVLITDGIDASDRCVKKASANPFTVLQEMPQPLKKLLLSDILIRFCEQIPYAFVVVWCMQTISKPVSAFQFGVLTTIEMVTAMVIYIPVAYMADRSGKKAFVGLTFVFFTLFPAVLFFCRTMPAFIVAFILRGLKEFGESTRKALIMELAPADRKASMFGLYYLLRDGIVSVAAFGGAFLWMLSPALNLFTAFGFGVAGIIWFICTEKNRTNGQKQGVPS